MVVSDNKSFRESVILDKNIFSGGLVAGVSFVEARWRLCGHMVRLLHWRKLYLPNSFNFSAAYGT